MGEDEDQKERRDRELIELLNELRVALPGVQVLFAFLLILPFSRGFPKLSDAERGIYLAAVLSTMLSTYAIDAGRLTTKGFGASKPVSPNASAEGRQNNRRVELVKM